MAAMPRAPANPAPSTATACGSGGKQTAVSLFSEITTTARE
jgi:hypothetical protein